MGCEALVDYVRCVSVCIYILRDQYQHSIICYLLQAENQIMSMSNTDKFTFEELQLWNSARLKDYLGDSGGESDVPACGPPASFSVHLASSAVTPAGSVHKSRGDNVVRMWVQLKR